MALRLTSWETFPSYPTIYFFLSHGLVVVALLTLTGGRVVRPRAGSPWRAFCVFDAYAAAVATFNWFFGTNYMFLFRKPVDGSILDFFGPWPAYVLVGEGFALLLFWLLWLPVAVSERSARLR